MKKKYIDPNRIITYNEGNCITKVEYNLLQNIANEERNRILKEYNLDNFDLEHKNRFIYDMISNNDYNDLSNIQKEIVLSNSIINDDVKLIDILTLNGFTLEHIKTIIRFRDKLKNLMLYNPILTKELKEDINTYKVIVSKLIDIVNQEFKTNNSTVILNKICILLTLYPELFSSISKHKSK